MRSGIWVMRDSAPLELGKPSLKVLFSLWGRCYLLKAGAAERGSCWLSAHEWSQRMDKMPCYSKSHPRNSPDKMEATAAMMKETMTPGPAISLATRPDTTYMPVPTQLPTPREMRSRVVRTLASLEPWVPAVPVPSSIDSTGLVRRTRVRRAWPAAPHGTRRGSRREKKLLMAGAGPDRDHRRFWQHPLRAVATSPSCAGGLAARERNSVLNQNSEERGVCSTWRNHKGPLSWFLAGLQHWESPGGQGELCFCQCCCSGEISSLRALSFINR